MEVLGEVLSHVRLKCRVLVRYEASGSWGVEVAPNDHALFYCIVKGRAVLNTDGESFQLTKGDFFVSFPGTGFQLRDKEGSEVVPIERLCGAIRRGRDRASSFGGGGAGTTIVVGSATLDGLSLSPIAQFLPPVLRLAPGSKEGETGPEKTVALIDGEMLDQASGYEAVVERLAEVLLLDAIRSHFRNVPLPARGLLDPRIGRALKSIHEDPKSAWTVDRLARVAGMSRSAFAVQFRSIIGLPPAEYVTRWRMQLASNRLRSVREAISQIAADLGYETESAFGKAFKRVVGVTPGAIREL